MRHTGLWFVLMMIIIGWRHRHKCREEKPCQTQ